MRYFELKTASIYEEHFQVMKSTFFPSFSSSANFGIKSGNLCVLEHVMLFRIAEPDSDNCIENDDQDFVTIPLQMNEFDVLFGD